jgi:hypothetical protein
MPNEPETTIVFRLHARPGAPFHAQLRASSLWQLTPALQLDRGFTA